MPENSPGVLRLLVSFRLIKEAEDRSVLKSFFFLVSQVQKNECVVRSFIRETLVFQG